METEFRIPLETSLCHLAMESEITKSMETSLWRLTIARLQVFGFEFRIL
jgi:hypothetical protein